MTTGRVVAPLRGTNNGTLLTGSDANAAAIKANPAYAGSPPYAPTVAAEGEIGANVPLVRVYNPTAGTNSSQEQGSWTMPKAEVIGLTPAQIRTKYALPNLPTNIVDVNATGIAARTGIAGQNFGAAGGGVQVQLLKFGATFTNPRRINGVAQ
jgi:filamentous hemagglutinin